MQEFNKIKLVIWDLDDTFWVGTGPIERHFNTLKSEFIYLYEYDTDEALYQAVEEFAYVEYNHVRPHSFNGYLTPYQARIA